MKRTPAVVAIVSSVVAVWAIGGCGGGGGDVEWVYGSEWDYPQYRYVTIYLRVEQPNGGPLAGAVVTINGEEVDGLTAGRWYAIGDDGPPEWRGWPHNWAVIDLPVRIDRPGQVRTLTIRARKAGWGWDSTKVRIADADPDYVFVRAVLVLGVATTEHGRRAKPEYFRPFAGARGGEDGQRQRTVGR